MSSFIVDIDTSQIDKALDSVDVKMKKNTIPIKLQNKVNQQVVKQQKKEYKTNHDPNFRNEVARSKNELPILNNFHYGKTKDLSGTYISNRTFYALFIEKGAELKPRNAEYLTFKINGEFKKIKSAKIEAKPFFYNIASKIWNSSEAESIMNVEIQKQLDKAFNA